MNILMMVLCVAFASSSIFLLAKFGIKNKEDDNFIVCEKKDY